MSQSVPKKQRIVGAEDFNLRDEIEKHHEMIIKRRLAKRQKSEVKMQKKDSEAITKGKAIAKTLNISPKSCCPRLFNALNPDIPEVKHNKPLSHMIRPMQIILK